MASSSKKPKLSNKRLTNYDREWEKEFPISCVANNVNAFYCIPCKKTVSCGHMGKADVIRHFDPKNEESTFHNVFLANLASL